MSKKEIIQCDTCEKSVEARQLLPPEWLTVTQSGELLDTGKLASSWAYAGDQPVAKFSQPELVFTGKKTLHFCRDECLAIWLQRRGNTIVPRMEEAESPYINIMCKPLLDGSIVSLTSGTVYRPMQEQADCKARRFLLVDGETADVTEGTRYANGYVSVEAFENSISKEHLWTYSSWDELKGIHPGCGVQWIDQETREEVSA